MRKVKAKCPKCGQKDVYSRVIITDAREKEGISETRSIHTLKCSNCSWIWHRMDGRPDTKAMTEAEMAAHPDAEADD